MLRISGMPLKEGLTAGGACIYCSSSLRQGISMHVEKKKKKKESNTLHIVYNDTTV